MLYASGVLRISGCGVYISLFFLPRFPFCVLVLQAGWGFLWSTEDKMSFKNLLKGAAVVAFLAAKVGAVDNGLAVTPQMGCEFFVSCF